ncbi:hypothetical protein ABZR86_02465 [Dyella marensis]|uniref:hypothetical protein n=1 Tax=Dyella TaxID=231454 RepID=UPI00047E403A|nr:MULTISPECIES: hypothetical protein [Dyella]
MNKPTSLVEACDRIAILEREQQILHGRLNAVHEVLMLLVLEREGPTEDLVAHMKLQRERTAAGLQGSPTAATAISEYLRVTEELRACAESVVQTRGTPRWHNGQPASQ